MVRLYIARANFTADAYDTALAACSETRRAKISALRLAADRYRSLAAAVAFAHALESMGLCAKSEAVAVQPGGKPYLPAHPALHFSLSHAGEFAVCAISDRQVGVDIEQERPFREAMQQRCFREAERAAALPLRLWVLKESYGKMTGRGLAVMETAELLFGETLRASERGVLQRASFWDDTFPEGCRIAVCCAGDEPFVPDVIQI